jgi:hypothetical protein
MDWTKGLLFALIFIAFIVIVITSCGDLMNLDFQAISKIYELKGIVESLVELADQDEQYNYPMIEKLESIL